MGKKKAKTKIIYREKKPTFDKEKAKKELEELQKKRQEIKASVAKEKEGKTGFSRFTAGVSGVAKQAGINKAINLKQKQLRQQQRIESTREQVNLLKQQTELATERQKLQAVRKKGAVDFGNIFGESSVNKEIKPEDIFR